jgi:DNA-binding LacI/PurR family transcriptional regulator/signal transduction histidine kinase
MSDATSSQVNSMNTVSVEPGGQHGAESDSAKKPKRIVSLFMHVQDHQVWWPVYNGVCQVARDNNSHLVFFASPTAGLYNAMNPETVGSAAGLFNGKSLDGMVIAFGGTGLLDFGEATWAKGLPVVLIAREKAQVPCVLCDNRSAIRRAVALLHGRGHRRIAFLNGVADSYSAIERLAGYQAGLADCGLVADDSLVVAGDFTEEVGFKQILAALQKGVTFTALVAGNDASAVGALRAIRHAQVRVPEDMEVIGFDNLPIGRWCAPPLSTHDMQFFPMGYLAAQELFGMLSGDQRRQKTLVPATLVARSSTRDGGGASKDILQFRADWMEHQFYYDLELARLRRDPAAAEMLASLSNATPEAFLAGFSFLIERAIQTGIEASCLYSILETAQTRAEHANGAFSGVFSRAFGLLAAAAYDEQRKRAEMAIRFRSAAAALRELSFETVDEKNIVLRLKDAIRGLQIPRSGMFLQWDDHPANGLSGCWHFWRLQPDGALAAEETPMSKADLDLRRIIEREPPSGWVMMPLYHGDRQFGFMLLQEHPDFVLYYSELVRHVSAALHGAHVYKALRESQRELLEASRLAGVAEMATGVLHNIGNAMNSVTTSANLTIEGLQKLRINAVSKVSDLLREHRTDLPGFFATDPRGSQLVTYLDDLGKNLQVEKASLLRECDELRTKVQHINQIVASQQNYAKNSFAGLLETVPPEELMIAALLLNDDSLMRHKVVVTREFNPVPPVTVLRQKIVQILTNLIRNAKQSLAQADSPEKRITVRLGAASEGRVRFEVVDNGVGIAPENLTRIFAFGFTTKADGHGFGLHASANTAKEMGGALIARSDGMGKGATFVLEIPCDGKVTAF